MGATGHGNPTDSRNIVWPKEPHMSRISFITFQHHMTGWIHSAADAPAPLTPGWLGLHKSCRTVQML